jgi:hypothetical protein
VRDDVVQLAGDAQALLGDRPAGELPGPARRVRAPLAHHTARRPGAAQHRHTSQQHPEDVRRRPGSARQRQHEHGRRAEHPDHDRGFPAATAPGQRDQVEREGGRGEPVVHHTEGHGQQGHRGDDPQDGKRPQPSYGERKPGPGDDQEMPPRRHVRGGTRAGERQHDDGVPHRGQSVEHDQPVVAPPTEKEGVVHVETVSGWISPGLHLRDVVPGDDIAGMSGQPQPSAAKSVTMPPSWL